MAIWKKVPIGRRFVNYKCNNLPITSVQNRDKSWNSMIIVKILLPAYANLTELSRYKRFFQEQTQRTGEHFWRRTYLSNKNQALIIIFNLKLDERTWNGLIFVCKLRKLEGCIWSAVYDLWITVIITVEFTTSKAGQIRSSSRSIDVFFLWENYLELKSKFYEQVKA